MKTPSTYDQQATDFLTRHGLKIAIKLSNSKDAPWQPSGNHYRVTLKRPKAEQMRACDKCGGMVNWTCPKCVRPTQPAPMLKSLSFDFWGSQCDQEKGEHPTPYDVLACIASDVHCPDTFEDFCAEYGYDEDSRKAEQTFRRASTFARKLRAFFTDAEQEELSEIQ